MFATERRIINSEVIREQIGRSTRGSVDLWFALRFFSQALDVIWHNGWISDTLDEEVAPWRVARSILRVHPHRDAALWSPELEEVRARECGEARSILG